MAGYKKILSTIFIASMLFEMGIKFFIEHMYGLGIFKTTMLIVLVFYPFLLEPNKPSVRFSTGWLKRIYFLFFTYYTYSLLGILFSDFALDGFVKCIIPLFWLTSSLLLILVLKEVPYENVRKIFKNAVVLASGIVIYFVVVNFVSKYTMTDLLDSKRWIGISPFSDRNVMIEVLTYCAIFFFYLNRGKFSVTILLLSLVAILILGLLTGTRRVFVFDAFIILSLFFTSYVKDRRLFGKLSLKLLLFFFVGLIVYSFKVGPTLNFDTLTIQRSLSVFDTDKFDSGRTNHYQEALELIASFDWYNLIIGRGTSYYMTMEHGYPHNFVLAAIMEGGVLKLGIIFLILASFYSVIAKHIRRFDFKDYFLVLSVFSIFLFSRSISYEEIFGDRLFLLLIFAVFLIRKRIDNNNALA